MLKFDSRPFLAFAILAIVGGQACLAQTEPAQPVSIPAQTPPTAAQTAAQQSVAGIGSASTISNRVEGFFGGDPRTLGVGSDVFQNELVRTALGSDAKLIFLDNTNLSVGPASEVTLDRFVYDPANSAGAVVVRTTKGIFRFVTGSQRSQNYLIATPIASIGVRGTIFDLLVQPDRVVVILIEGQIEVTTLLNRVVSLTRAGTSLTVYADGRVVGPSAWRGTIHVPASAASFPYFAPVDEIKEPVKPEIKKKAAPPRVKKAAAPTRTEEPPKRDSGIRIGIGIGGGRIGGYDRPGHTRPTPPPPTRGRPN
jgi:hypothetical protein